MPEFMKSPYWDIQTRKVKSDAPPEIRAELEKAYQEYHAEREREFQAWVAATSPKPAG
jgi:hypothetical protein